MGTLKVGKINLNDPVVVDALRKALNQLVQTPQSYYQLRFKPKYYFEVPNGPLPSGSGWYVILEDRKPIYAGQANNLNNRLNTSNGSTDNFGREERKSDPERNIIKKINELMVLKNLKVCIIMERDLCSKLHINQNDLTKLDRQNIEKIISILRVYFSYI